jgi:hemoglobin
MLAKRDIAQTLYEQIGGKAAVSTAVDGFYTKVIGDPLLRPFFDGVDLKRQRAKQVSFLTMVFGGPTKYTGKDLRSGHAHLVKRGLSDQHFDAVAGHLHATLKELKVEPHLMAEVMRLVATTRDEVLNR